MAAPSNPEKITLSVFISSPGELISTRSTAKDVIAQMEIVVDGIQVSFTPMLYEEHTPALVGPGNSPQQLVNRFMGTPNEMDIYVGMLWTRLGSETVVMDRRQRSGTRYEFDVAYKSLRLSGKPQMLLYQCMRPVGKDGDSESQAEVDSFFDGFRGDHPQFEGFPQPFVDDDEFAKLLSRDLGIIGRNIVLDKLVSEINGKGRDLAELVGSVRNWLATFEDLFGKGISENQERERDRLFQIHFRSLPYPTNPGENPTQELRPRRNESLLDVFDERGGRMLMVGERGTGKTFAMLRLMQDLTDRAFIKRGQPVPVFFNLSSWNETYREDVHRSSALLRVMQWLFPQPPRQGNTMELWLEDQLVRNYSMQRKAARLLLGHNEVIFCLDGLDELSAAAVGAAETINEASSKLRDRCVQAINATLRNNSVRMVLCCRADTYHELTTKPHLDEPLQTQLLTAEEVFEDLSNWPRLEGLKAAMQQSPMLVERARVALFLGMMRTAYQDMSAVVILKASRLSARDWERHLLDHYVDQCMKLAPPDSVGLNKDLIPSCLSWIAQMQDNDFLLDDLQPSLLRTEKQEDGFASWRLYRRFSASFMAACLMVLETIPIALCVGIAHGYKTGPWSGITQGLLMCCISAVILFPLYLSAFSARNWVRYGLSFGLAWALDSAACIWLTVPGWNAFRDGSWEGAVNMFLISLPCACFFFLLMGSQFFGRLNEHKRTYPMQEGVEWHEIKPIEPMNWCWFDGRSYWKGGWIGLAVGPLILLLTWLAGQGMRGTAAAVIVGMLVTMFSGLSGTGIARVSIKPNQGIDRSLRHALVVTALFVIGGSFCWGLVYTLHKDWIHGLLGAIMGLTLTFAFFVFGGWPVIQQFCLGCILHQEGKLPSWNCWPPWKATVEFLDDLVRYKLLRRSAGGYMFRHQSLREYYRNLSEHSADPQGPIPARVE